MRRSRLIAGLAAALIPALIPGLLTGCSLSTAGKPAYVAGSSTGPATGSSAPTDPTGSGDPAGSPTTPPTTPSKTPVSSATLTTLNETIVCARVGLVVSSANTAFSRLPQNAPKSQWLTVAKSFDAARRQMMTALRQSRLPTKDLVRVRGNEVIKETAKIARLLRTADSVNNHAFIAAYRRLDTACPG